MHGGESQSCLSSSFWLLFTLIFLTGEVSGLKTKEFRAKICEGILCSFQHLEFDTGNNKVYVGAINRIYQLDVNLKQEQSAKTGSVLDSDTCYPHQPCSDPKRPTNNFNKLLKIDSDNNRIVACGSIRQGLCDLRKLGNVSHVLNDFSTAKDKRTNDFVSSTSLDQTTVAFIANEGDGGSEKSLYVGTARTSLDSKLISDADQFPTFTSRRMPPDNMDPAMFSSDLNSKESAGLLTKEDFAKQGFRVNFVSAFEGNQNGYFVLNYPKIKDDIIYKDDVYSYVAQVCMRGSDARSTTNSYFEIPISSLSWLGGSETELHRAIASTTAQVGGILQRSLGIRNVIGGGNPDVLFVSFATEGKNAGGSTLAIFPLYELDKIYYQIVQACLSGHKMNHIEWQRESAIPCNKIEFPIREPLCSNHNIWDVVGLFKSNITKRGYTVFESNDTVVTSVAVTRQGEHTVAFMGTKNGRLLKLKVDSKPSGNRLTKPYEEIQIDSHSDSLEWKNLGSPQILADMRLDNDLTRLYVMSERRLVGLPLHDCAKFQSCFDCLNAGDPFCGWCTLDNKCTAAVDCAKGRYSYATSDPTNCPKLTDVIPSALPVTADPELIRVTISNIPRAKLDGHYTCVYGGGSSGTVANHIDSYITCMSPSRSDVPDLDGKEVSVPLSLYYTKEGSPPTIIASAEIVFYNCMNFKSCLPCLSPIEFKCHWCTNDNQCRQTKHPCKTYPADLSRAEQCPRLLRVIEPPHIHLDQSRRVKLQVENLKEIIGGQPRFNCKFTIDGMKGRTVNATRSRNDILCGPIKGFLPADAYETEAKVDLFWNNNFIIDNPNTLNVTMYRCSRGPEDNCGKCLQLGKDLACGWCEKDSKCSLCDECLDKPCSNETGGLYPGWLDEAQVCMNPEITDFYPKSATPGGVTKITIEGNNLGKVFRKSDGRIEVGIRVADQECNVLREGFKESERVMCEVRDVYGESENLVKLCILDFQGSCRGADYTATSVQKFEFVEPSLDRFTPQQGLYAGGTKITFTGEHLDIGNGVSVFIDGRSCPVEKGSITSGSFECKLACESTSRRRRRHTDHQRWRHHHRRHHNSCNLHRRKRTTGARVKLVFDEKIMYYEELFSLESDVPKEIPLNRKESIKSGGMRLTVTGNNLDLAQTLVLEVSFEGHIATSKCEPPDANNRIRDCMSPAITGYPTGNYSAKLIFDDCLTRDIGSIRYTEDPYLDMFSAPGNVMHHQGGPIIISGRNLCPNPLNCDESSAKVMIGDDLTCNITDLDKDKLVCVPPTDSGGTHLVKVSIGGYSQTVGELEFESGFPTYGYILIAIFVVFVLIVVGVACLVYRRAGKKMKEVKAKQMEFDMMEAKVAKECKEAFAELQTDIQSDPDNMGSVGIPFRPRHDYIMRVLFPEPEMYDKLTIQAMSTPYTSNMRYNVHNGRGAPHRALCSALDDFDKLLENKTFLLIFIYTLEGQKKFSMKDRSNIAGLLMIVLQNRLQYATRILEELLSRMIRDVIESGSNTRLLLRRSESVAEKMLTHWFSILLHGFLLECAGEPLFMLYRAIKAQLDKGPIDAITGFARYSLNQDKLLRQAISFGKLILIVTDNESDHPGRELHVRVLDCDTITQTKEKIIAIKYKNQPQSAHPSPDAFDLELKNDPLGQAILNDEDKTSVVEGVWKRVNTLLHYKVKDKAVVTMVPKRPNVLNQSINSNNSFGQRITGMRYNGSGHRLINDGAGSLPRHISSMQGSRSTTPTLIDDGKKLYHLMKQHDNEPRDGTIDGSMVSEIYLTRLLVTKGTIQKFVDDSFETIFSVVQRGHALPLAIKHMFDFFDEQAEYYGITDPDVVHTWKSNSLPLRFWVNLIKNPEFLFDIKKTPLVDSCLSVIAGTFMDSCSRTDPNLGKDSPSSKLLYAKDVVNYKKWVTNYYDEISSMEHLSPQDMQCFLQDESRTYGRTNAYSQEALTQLYVYVQKFNSEILDALNDDPAARNQRLSQRLEQVANTMTSTV